MSDHRGARWNLTADWPVAENVQIYDLAHRLTVGIPHHPNHPPYSFTLTKEHGEVMYPEGVSAAAEMITTGGHVGTHVDGLAHVSKDGQVHGGVSVIDNQSYGGGVRVSPIDEMAPIIARGHLVNLPTLLGRATTPDDTVTRQHFEDWFESAPGPQPGDVVLVRTGWDEHWDDNHTYLGVDTGCPGVGIEAAHWLTDRGVIATGCDTVAYEKMPNPTLDVHVHLLVDSAVPIMEAMNLRVLAEAEVHEFHFMAIPLAIGGGTGSPIRPLAIVPGDETS